MLDVKKVFSIIEDELHDLPDQAPIEHFVHHNTLHCHENHSFETAVEEAFYKYGRSPYMGLKYFRRKLQEREIDPTFLRRRLAENGFKVEDNKLFDYIQDRLHSFKDLSELEFLKSEGLIYNFDFVNLVPADEQALKLWEKIDELDFTITEKNYPDFHPNKSLGRVNKMIVPFIASMLDQGQANEQLSLEERQSVWKTFYRYLKAQLSTAEYKVAKNYSTATEDKKVLLSHVLIKKAQNESELRRIVRTHFYSLPGWAGMVHKSTYNREVFPRREVFLDIYDYLAMRLILEEALRDSPKVDFFPVTTNLQLKSEVFYCTLYFGPNISLEDLIKLFNSLDRIVLKRVFQQAYEDTYQSNILTGIQNKNTRSFKSPPKYQMFFCIDDREESFRRYLEEASPFVETFGVAGFFGLDMMYQKLGEPKYRRFCPPAAKPAHLVRELGEAKSYPLVSLLHDSRGNFFTSTVLNFIYAPFRSLELKLQIFFPRTKGKISKKLKMRKVNKIDYFSQEQKIQGGLKYGYTQEESAQKVLSILKGAGLITEFAPYILMIGHGHDSFNNPHVAAYRCGACSGTNASPNAKIFALMANDREVRKILRENHGFDIPDSCLFIGGYHDTCNDNVELFGSDTIPAETLQELKTILLKARQNNAKERCRKFYQESGSMTPMDALKTVENRAWRVAEPRPELNHATNSLCIVGKRELTKNIFLDRKAFLVSYDAAVDTDEQILTALLSAVVPVCAGINLEYYFSKVDTENYGSGSKTSHNVTGLLGVMNGVRGDLRTGLVWQMVEYHDPLRILFIVQTSEEAILKVMERNQEVKNLITNGWIALSIVSPDNHKDIKIFRNGLFEKFSPGLSIYKEYESSSQIASGLMNPIHCAYLKGRD